MAGEFAKIGNFQKSKMQKVLIFSPEPWQCWPLGWGDCRQMRSWSQTWCLMQQQAHVSVCVDTWLHGRCSHCSLTRILTLWLWNLQCSWFTSLGTLQITVLCIFCTRKSEIWKFLKLIYFLQPWWRLELLFFNFTNPKQSSKSECYVKAWYSEGTQLHWVSLHFYLPNVSAVFAFPNPKRSLPRYGSKEVKELREAAFTAWGADLAWKEINRSRQSQNMRWPHQNLPSTLMTAPLCHWEPFQCHKHTCLLVPMQPKT